MPLTRSENMARIKGKNTVPEVLLRQLLWSSGKRYRKNLRVHGVRPDIVFSGSKVAVFVDGCFWHGCPLHYCAPKTRSAFWSGKLTENFERDRKQTLELEAHGWKVIRVWEHQITADAEAAAASVLITMDDRRSSDSKDWRITSVEKPTGADSTIWHLEALRSSNISKTFETTNGSRPSDIKDLLSE